MERPSPIVPIANLPGNGGPPTAEDINRVITDINNQFDALWAQLAALEIRLAVLER